jgi:hypothetical protein
MYLDRDFRISGLLSIQHQGETGDDIEVPITCKVGAIVHCVCVGPARQSTMIALRKAPAARLA